jgi:hypothetical protein
MNRLLKFIVFGCYCCWIPNIESTEPPGHETPCAEGTLRFSEYFEGCWRLAGAIQIGNDSFGVPLGRGMRTVSVTWKCVNGTWVVISRVKGKCREQNF